MTENLKSRSTPRPNDGSVSPRANPAVSQAKDIERQNLAAQRDDPGYFQSRAEQEVAQAQRATNPAAVAVHYELAELYLERVTPNSAESRSAS